MRISDWSSDVCSSDLAIARATTQLRRRQCGRQAVNLRVDGLDQRIGLFLGDTTGKCLFMLRAHRIDRSVDLRDHGDRIVRLRSEEHTSALQSLMLIPYAGFCLNKKKKKQTNTLTL